MELFPGPAVAANAATPTDAKEWVWLARILRPQGRKGEVFANLLTDFPEKFAERKQLWLLADSSNIHPAKNAQAAQPAIHAQASQRANKLDKSPEASGHDFSRAAKTGSNLKGTGFSPYINPAKKSGALAPKGHFLREVELLNHWPHKGGIVLHFAGIDSISAAETLKGMTVAIPRAARATLADDEIYVGDLIGCVVIDVAGAEPVLVGEIEEVDRSAGPVALLVVNGASGEVLIPFAKSYLRKIDLAAKRVEMALPEGLVELNAPSSLKPNQLTQETMRETIQGKEIHQAKDAVDLFKKMGI